MKSGETAVEKPGVESICRVLTDSARRAVIRELAAASRPRTVDELAGRLEPLADGDRDRVHLALHHRHLPQLIDAGLIEKGPGGRVALTASGRRIDQMREQLIDVLPELEST